ncbi:hypothetical protein GCM10011506_08160 [Marivirga lumbricoides]|uniref:DUF4367 domain-containing protein n=1 Tax=Marivirga lumbricoides TaxID=1046115 RepID=A0ABQ1LJ57_9BACT|nr:hypothetical protein GCM10011506_08160 [Marivirga lumbricoides]
MKSTYILSIIIILFSCQSGTKDQNIQTVEDAGNSTVFIKRYGSRSELKGIDSAVLKVAELDNSKRYQYVPYDKPDANITYYEFKILENEDSLYFYEAPCPLIDTAIYSVNNKDYKVLKYYYDVENSVDEESVIYFTDKYGVLIIFNEGWYIMEGIFDYDEISKQLANMILSDSTQSFPVWESNEN